MKYNIKSRGRVSDQLTCAVLNFARCITLAKLGCGCRLSGLINDNIAVLEANDPIDEHKRTYLVSGIAKCITFCQLSNQIFSESGAALPGVRIFVESFDIFSAAFSHGQTGGGDFGNVLGLHDIWGLNEFLQNLELCFYIHSGNNQRMNELFLLPTSDIEYFKNLDKNRQQKWVDNFDTIRPPAERYVGLPSEIGSCLNATTLNLLI